MSKYNQRQAPLSKDSQMYPKSTQSGGELVSC